MNGFGLWVGREIKLWKFWVISLMTTVPIFGLYFFLPELNNIFVTIVVVVISLAWTFSSLITIFVTVYRVMHIVKERAPWIVYLLGFCFFALVITYAAMQGILLPDLAQFFMRNLLQFTEYALIAMLIGKFALMSHHYPHSDNQPQFLLIEHKQPKRLQKLQRAFQTFRAFLIAKKNRVCPGVNPPDDFEVK